MCACVRDGVKVLCCVRDMVEYCMCVEGVMLCVCDRVEDCMCVAEARVHLRMNVNCGAREREW